MKRFHSLFDEDFFKSFRNTHDVLVQSSIGLGDHYITEAETEFNISLFLPGFDKESFDIGIENSCLVVKATPKALPTGKKLAGNFPTKEIQRIFPIETSISEAKVSATYVDGILSITLPKDKSAKVNVKVK